jgi:hypothetical protein
MPSGEIWGGNGHTAGALIGLITSNIEVRIGQARSSKPELEAPSSARSSKSISCSKIEERRAKNRCCACMCISPAQKKTSAVPHPQPRSSEEGVLQLRLRLPAAAAGAAAAAAAAGGGGSPIIIIIIRHRRMSSSAAFTTHYRSGAPRRRDTMRKTSSTAQPRQGRGRTATCFDADHGLGTWDQRSGPLGPLEPDARCQRSGGGGWRALVLLCTFEGEPWLLDLCFLLGADWSGGLVRPGFAGPRGVWCSHTQLRWGRGRCARVMGDGGLSIVQLTRCSLTAAPM